MVGILLKMLHGQRLTHTGPTLLAHPQDRQVLGAGEIILAVVVLALPHMSRDVQRNLLLQSQLCNLHFFFYF